MLSRKTEQQGDTVSGMTEFPRLSDQMILLLHIKQLGDGYNKDFKQEHMDLAMRTRQYINMSSYV